MFGTLITRISGFFDKAFLFAAVLPTLIFSILIFAPLAGIIGFDSVALWVDSLTGAKKAALTVVGLTNLIVFAYLLNALQTSFVRWWSGDIKFFFPIAWLISLGIALQTYRFRKLREKTFATSSWETMWKTFMATVDKSWSVTHPPANPAQIRKLCIHIAKLHEFMERDKAQEQLDVIAAAYQKISAESLGDRVYRPLKLRMQEFYENDEARLRGILVTLDKEFGDLQTIYASRLGNIVESYSQYASKRYDIEMGVFWPHLRNVMPKPFLDSMGDQKILLDFALTMATLCIAYSLSCVLFGPWIWYRPLLWGTLALIGCVLARLFYRLGITAAANYGDFWRAAFDLYRLDLMKALQRPRPASLVTERKQWMELSKLAIYADPADFDLRQESSPLSENARPDASATNFETSPEGKKEGANPRPADDAGPSPSASEKEATDY
jgi:hypothetical protein